MPAPPKDRFKHRGANGVEIRDMELEDLWAVFQLGEQLFTRDVPNLYRTWDEYEVTEYFQTEPELSLVAALGDRVVGFAMGTIYEKRRSAWRYGHLVWFGVDPNAGRRGVGGRLLKEMRLRMQKLGARIMLADTESDNEHALAFFKKHGFGNPHEHVYLSMNLSTQRNRTGEKTRSGTSRRRAARPGSAHASRRPSGQVVPNGDAPGAPPLDTADPALTGPFDDSSDVT